MNSEFRAAFLPVDLKRRLEQRSQEAAGVMMSTILKSHRL